MSDPKISKDPAYRCWINMKSRCYTPSANHYDLYGGRGITVCDAWVGSFAAFLSDMGPRPSQLHSVDRIDPNGHYDPENCRWADKKEQQRNLRCNHIVMVYGDRMTLAEAAEKAGLKYNTLLYRLKRGWPIERAIR